MDGLSLLIKARSAGLTIEAQGDRLVIRGPKTAGAIAKELIENKAVVMAALTAASLPPAEGEDAPQPSPDDDVRGEEVERPEDSGGSDADAGPRDPTNLDDCREHFCDLLRLLRAANRAAIVAGDTLAKARSELGCDEFPSFVTTRLPWSVPEAETMIRFAQQVGLRAEQLTPAIAVPLARMLEAAGLLGRLHLEQQGEAKAQTPQDGQEREETADEETDDDGQAEIADDADADDGITVIVDAGAEAEDPEVPSAPRARTRRRRNAGVAEATSE